MSIVNPRLSTGLAGLDRVLKGLIPGDNIVFQVDSIEDYAAFVEPYYRYALSHGERVTYFRFARHAPLIPENSSVDIHSLQPDAGFETFVTQVHEVIEKNGKGGYYVFDLLSDLAADWYSDRMLGNFFTLTCPYLLDIEALAYFSVLKNKHSFHAISPITETTQVLLDIHRHQGKQYVHPLKVQQRYSPTIHMLHVRDGDQFHPVTQSAVTAEILTSGPWSRLESASVHLGPWTQAFTKAEQDLGDARQGKLPQEKEKAVLQRLLRMAISRDERVLRLAETYFTLEDIIEIRRRMIGTGLIGGKAVGMLLARAILRKTDSRWNDILEAHDSFFIGSDVFYTYLVQNGCWWVRQKLRDPENYLSGAEEARQRILTGVLPEYISKQLADMLDYFGQSPIIVRSSSLLEDNFGNSFAGKYESVFCANQGSRHKRLEDFLSAVKTIYASTMSEKALLYRAQRGLLQRDEQMALLVQRVSGSFYGSLFYPQVAGVGFSYNPYVWSEYIDPDAGVLRLVFGLGTRAVDRSDDDYTRVVALNAPERRPEQNFDEVRQYSQRRVDVLDLEANQLISDHFEEILQRSRNLPVHLFTTQEGYRNSFESTPATEIPPVLTFEHLLTRTPFVQDMKEILATIEAAYDYPVDMEFTTNFLDETHYRINLVQCRPLQVQGGGTIMDPPTGIERDAILLECEGPVIGQSRLSNLDRIIYVVPSLYGNLPVRDRHAIARLIGKIIHSKAFAPSKGALLMGPGRWGTTTPALGVPVSFSEINTISVLCEIVAMREDFVPDVSLGTHFFHEMVEADILYLALFPKRENNHLNTQLIENAPNRLTGILPDASDWTDIVRVIDPADLDGSPSLRIYANAVRQKVICYLET